MGNVMLYQWAIVIVSSLILIGIAPVSRTVASFFQATTAQRQPSAWLLTSSLVISWIFAKSITNAANLGLSYGIVGGVAYAGYYLSFLVAGIVIFRMRKVGRYTSLHQFLASRYGLGAVVVFSLLIGFRLFNEVWSNTMVIGTYFGAQGTASYYGAIGVFTILTLAYTLKGGLRSSLLTDVIQLALFGVLLFIILGVIVPRTEGGWTTYAQSGRWTWAEGLNLLWVAVLQSLSYPFHDPVLTDRGFIAPPRVTLWSYVAATIIGAACIVLFSLVGVYAQLNGMDGEAAVQVSQTLGVAMMLMMNAIMVTSAASTLDSTFNSFAKMAVIDLRWARPTVRNGRMAMALLAVLGTIPIFLNPTILSATTVSGTMVMGLAPVFLGWRVAAPVGSYYLSVGLGMAFGVVLAVGAWPAQAVFFPGAYGELLSVNLVGLAACLVGYWGPVAFRRMKATDQSPLHFKF